LANTSSVTFLSGSAGKDGACYYKYCELKFSEDNFAGMQIYFGFTVAGDRSAVNAATKIVGILEEMGHEVLTRHLVEENAWEADRSITPKEVYLRDMKWLEQCDMFIAEVSGSSFGLGFETGYLLGATTKKVVLFYRREVESKISLLITGVTHPNCTLVPYSDFSAVEVWIRNNLAQ
jgi:nucleoside 2-deoxyribosyltransferase